MRVLELFSGTGSIGRAFKARNWEVVSLDMDPKSLATHTCDFMTWNWAIYPPGHFQCVWSSPPCTAYSCARTTGKQPRDLEGSDRLVGRVLECIAYFQPTLVP
jgi:site-specific DNA-cytosine methylase